MAERVVVIGAVAAGMSAASQALRVAKRNERTLDVVVVDSGNWTSYSACGIPYWVAGDIADPQDLVARTAEQHRRNGIDLRLGTEATALDLDRRTVAITDLGSGTHDRLDYDHLVLTTGAEPVRPNLPGVDAAGVYGVETIEDGTALLDHLAGDVRHAVVVGAGYIGIEMAEAMVRRGLDVTVVDKAEQPMTTLDPELGKLVHDAMEGMGIKVVTSAEVAGFDTDDAGTVTAVRTSDSTFPADLVVLGIGVRPTTSLAKAAGVPLGDSGGIVVDDHLRVPGLDRVWAAGDCVESWHRVLRRPAYVPLGTHANRQGRILGTNLAGDDITYPGVLGTAVSKVCDLEVGRTGLGEGQAAAEGYDSVSVTIESSTRAGYFPGAKPITVKVIAERGSGRLLGAQIVGRTESAKRIDPFAVALWNEMTVDELAMADLSYAPPFSPALDPVTIAARKTAETLGRL